MQSYGPPKLRESQLSKFRNLRISGQNDIWVLVSWPGTKYTIRGKVVAFPKFRLWWILWICVCPWLIRAPKCSNYALTKLLFGLCEWLNCLSIFLVPSHSSSMPFYPWSVASQGAHPNSFSFHYFHLWTPSWIHQRAWGCVNSTPFNLIM